jgi:hypothetical protein
MTLVIPRAVLFLTGEAAADNDEEEGEEEEDSSAAEEGEEDSSAEEESSDSDEDVKIVLIHNQALSFHLSGALFSGG